MQSVLRAGASSSVINCELGSLIQGAGDPHQRAESVRDDLEANALFLADADTAVLLVTCDLGGLEPERVRRYTASMATATGLTPESILIGCSHTHGGPVVLHTNYQKPVDEGYSTRLEQRLTEVARTAVETAFQARIGWGAGQARLGYNRRVCYADGTHSMYRESGRNSEFTGVEGPDDTECLALAVFDEENRIRAVLHHGTGHPASTYGRQFLSADYPGLARQLIRQAHGSLPVLFFNGSLGDIAMRRQTHPHGTPDSMDAQITRAGCTLAGATLRLIHEMIPQATVQLRHRRTELELPVRLPTAEAIDRGRALLARMDAGEAITGMEAIFAWGPVSLMEQFGADPVDKLAFHALRLGDLAIATHPFELFCQYQLDIKRRSPADTTAVFGLTDGYGGYLPTLAGALGGGYSGTPFSWARFSPEAGCRVVDHAAAMLHALWAEAPQAR